MQSNESIPASHGSFLSNPAESSIHSCECHKRVFPKTHRIPPLVVRWHRGGTVKIDGRPTSFADRAFLTATA